MSRIKSLFFSLKMTAWFVKTSWRYVTTKKISSKIEFIAGILPAWVRFTFATYKDFRKQAVK
jgi:hypothetical protein